MSIHLFSSVALKLSCRVVTLNVFKYFIPLMLLLHYILFLFFLQKNEPYHLDVFIAERYKCNSQILFQASGVSFLTDNARPLDYVAVVSEIIHVGSIVQVN